MGIQHEEKAPASFGEALAKNYLGNPELVASLLGEFAQAVEQSLGELASGKSSKEAFVDQLNGEVRHYADIFAGRDFGFSTIAGFHGQSLGYKLMADLGEFWRSHRSKWGDDPYCVFFEWLAVMVAESVKRADGDDMLLEIMLKPTMQQAAKNLLGIEARQ